MYMHVCCSNYTLHVYVCAHNRLAFASLIWLLCKLKLIEHIHLLLNTYMFTHWLLNTYMFIVIHESHQLFNNQGLQHC